MKTVLIAMLVMVISTVGMLSVQNVSAIPGMSPYDLYKQSDMVFYGQVISKNTGPGPDYYYYQVRVDTYFKNPQNSDSITVAGHKSDNPRVPYPQFDVGDKAIFYINKLDGVNTMSPYSQKADSACDVSSFVGPGMVFHDTRIMRGGYTSEIRVLDSDGNAIPVAVINQHLTLKYDGLANGTPQARNVTVVFTIQKYNDTQLVFYQKRDIPLIACGWTPNPTWNFTPLTSGHYNATVTYDDKKIETDFDVRENLSTAKIDKAIILSPLKQFKSGIKPSDTTCQVGLQLIFKAEDNSPACVKLDSIKKLVSLPWALKPDNELTVDEFKDTYKAGDKIDFTLKFKGLYACGYPSSIVKNMENKVVWESPILLTLCDPDTGYGEYKWKFGGLYTLILNETGSYNMIVSFSDKTLEKKFEIR